MAIEPTISGGSKVTTMSLQDSGTTYEVFGKMKMKHHYNGKVHSVGSYQGTYPLNTYN
jgi:hypothetical protein